MCHFPECRGTLASLLAESMEHWTATFGGQMPSPIFSQIQPFATSMSDIAIQETMNGMEQNGTR